MWKLCDISLVGLWLGHNKEKNLNSETFFSEMMGRQLTTSAIHIIVIPTVNYIILGIISICFLFVCQQYIIQLHVDTLKKTVTLKKNPNREQIADYKASQSSWMDEWKWENRTVEKERRTKGRTGVIPTQFSAQTSEEKQRKKNRKKRKERKNLEVKKGAAELHQCVFSLNPKSTGLLKHEWLGSSSVFCLFRNMI